MNIKTFIPTCIAATCVISCLTSCEEDLTPHGVAPSSIEDIRLNVMQDIRPGQPLTASITLPVGGENIAEVEYKWEASASSDSIVNGVAYYSFKAPKEAGNHSLSFKARYLFTGPDTEGNIYKDLTSELDYTVVPCDIFSSKWSDNTAKTKEVYPGLVQADGQPGTYIGVFADPLSLSSSATINRAFQFQNDQLTKITEFETFSNNKSKAYLSHLGLLRRTAIKDLGMEGGKSYYVAENNPEGAQTEFDADLALDEWDATIGDKIMNGEIRIYSELQSESTTLLISVFSSGNGNGEVYFTRDYTLRQ